MIRGRKGADKVVLYIRYQKRIKDCREEHEVFSGISNTEKEQFLKIFEKLYQNITKEE